MVQKVLPLLHTHTAVSVLCCVHTFSVPLDRHTQHAGAVARASQGPQIQLVAVPSPNSQVEFEHEEILAGGATFSLLLVIS